VYPTASAHHARPPCARSYPYVLRGYRAGGTHRGALASLFEWHAETLNAWTMIWGAAISAALLARALGALRAAGVQARGYWPAAPDAAAFVLLTAATLLHAPFSVGFHLFRGISRDVYSLWRRLDQVAIFQVRRPRAWSGRVRGAARRQPAAVRRAEGARGACPPLRPAAGQPPAAPVLHPPPHPPRRYPSCSRSA
jgi:hypothetical protein